MEVIRSLGRGNLTNDSTLESVIVSKLMPRVLVPLRYLITRLTYRRWDLVAFVVYLASMLVIVAMSGRVDIESQVKQPIRTCIVCVFSEYSVDGERGVGMESTGYPDR